MEAYAAGPRRYGLFSPAQEFEGLGNNKGYEDRREGSGEKRGIAGTGYGIQQPLQLCHTMSAELLLGPPVRRTGSAGARRG
ncbi:hypothetical protein SKAU_G00340370 [Synaphobranchus kaupii]|uniref:Uncharacterized protein n=1 Tax=Synaphobranchus kaupii TaxID=118154 RepID=A0A9Q1IJD1_SYNKA|nr:hypothetical protein SKAU_G00340370 [Synaphobranchus kaupii]